MEGILIGTGILWALTFLVVRPITNFLVSKKLTTPEYSYLLSEELSEENQKKIKELVTHCFILTDIIVLGIAGLIGGLLGYWFIGIAFGGKHWPGMLTFIVMSFLGLGIRTLFFWWTSPLVY